MIYSFRHILTHPQYKKKLFKYQYHWILGVGYVTKKASVTWHLKLRTYINYPFYRKIIIFSFSSRRLYRNTLNRQSFSYKRRLYLDTGRHEIIFNMRKFCWGHRDFHKFRTLTASVSKINCTFIEKTCGTDALSHY